MKYRFEIDYLTRWGEELRLLMTDGAGRQTVHPMQTADGRSWHADVATDEDFVRPATYAYCVCRDGIAVRQEWASQPRPLPVAAGRELCRVRDAWRDEPEESFLVTAAFVQLFGRAGEKGSPEEAGADTVLTLLAPQLGRDYEVGVCGSIPALGCWDPGRACWMSGATHPVWRVALTLGGEGAEYKFVARRRKSRSGVVWEAGANRVLPACHGEGGTLRVANAAAARFDLPLPRAAGVNVPLFSLRSEGSFGVGDLGDLRLLVDWARLTGQRLIQLLPIYDTTMTHTAADSYPYSCISNYALHPMYVDLRQLPPLTARGEGSRVAALRRRLNALPQVDYVAVNRAKRAYLRRVFRATGQELMSSADYQAFYRTHRHWLRPYAAFCYLRDASRTAHTASWGPLATYSDAAVDRLCRECPQAQADVDFHCFIQYHLHRQLQAASDYARAQGVVLKADIPIGISPDSVETWTAPGLFNMQWRAGAPPDEFAADGQNWGFPTYNWEAMAQQGYRWWTSRLTHMARSFDAYRIDHVLGFFRIWQIPATQVSGLLGQFYPALPLSVDDMAGFGFSFSMAHAQPLIDDALLSELFGTEADAVRRRYLEPTTNGYRLKPPYATQRLIHEHFATRLTAARTALRDKLSLLLTDVLFVPDARQPHRYHPRIGGLSTHAYRRLSDSDREAYRRLYHDFYYHRHNDFWASVASRRLPAVTLATRMTPCGEDLGMIPACVPQVMNRLRVLSLEVPRMPKQLGTHLAEPAAFPYASVATLATHDMSTLRGWYAETVGRQRAAHYLPCLSARRRPRMATDAWCRRAVSWVMAGRSALCVLLLQDWLSLHRRYHGNPDAERINVPSNPRHYWRYRMPVTLEQLLRDDRLNRRISRIIRQAGR